MGSMELCQLTALKELEEMQTTVKGKDKMKTALVTVLATSGVIVVGMNGGGMRGLLLVY